MNISLIGMMGSGKTTIARILSKNLPGFVFIDTDSLIITNEKRTINEIFEKNGENYFRKIESEILKNVLKNDNQIISTGGGIIKSVDNLRLLKENSVVFYLKASPDTLYERVKNNKERPLLNVEAMREKIIILLDERENFYQKAHHIIITDNKTPDIIVNEILKEINKYDRS